MRPSCAHDVGDVVVAHREVRVVPVAEAAEALELFALLADVGHRVLFAELADVDLRERGLVFLLVAKLFLDAKLDRQAVAVPARDEVALKARHVLVLDDDVFQNFVERVAEVDVAVGVRRAVVENELGFSLALRNHPLVNLVAFPLLDANRLALRQACFHRKIGLG